MSANLFFYAVTVFFEFFFCLCSYSFKFFPNYLFMQLQFFFLPELILHKFSVEGYSLKKFTIHQQQQQASIPRVPLFCGTFSRWIQAGSPAALLSEESSDDCARGGDTSSSRSLRPWPRLLTTQPYGNRRRPGLGRRRARCTTRLRSGRLFLPSRSSSACTRTSTAGSGLPAWQSRQGHRRGSRGTPWSSLANSFPWCRGRLSKCPRSSSRTSRCEPWSVGCSWRNSRWKCQCLPSATVSSRRRCRRSFWHGTWMQMAANGAAALGPGGSTGGCRAHSTPSGPRGTHRQPSTVKILGRAEAGRSGLRFWMSL